MTRVIRYASLAVLLSSPIFAQSDVPSLEVASVRKHVSTSAQGGGVTVSGSRVTVVDYMLSSLILEAYKVKLYQIAGAPDWMGGGSSFSDIVARSRSADSYDISAKAEGDAALTRDQARLILQAVLADRFQLKVHRETKDLPVYALVLGKNGPKLKESAPDAKPGAGYNSGPGGVRMTNWKTTTTQFAAGLSLQADRPVVDKTGLTGFYDIALEWSRDDGQHSALGVPRETDDAGPSLFTAVQEQLGLKLETARAPIEVLVIDHAEKPSEN